MKNASFALVLTFWLSSVTAQHFSVSLQSLIDAERAFARTSKETNTLNAFISFLSPSAVLLVKGEEVNGIEVWKKRESDESLLTWEPIFADLASSEDFGYTTGPYAYYPNRKDTVPAFRGYYSTVWAKEATGDWKVLFDLGGGISTAANPELSTSAYPLKPSKKKQDTDNGLKELLAIDKTYSNRLNASHKSFDLSYLSSEGRIHRPAYLPFVGTEKIKTIKEDSQRFSFTSLNGKIASSCDMGYTYGKVMVTTFINGAEQENIMSTFRIWKKEGKIWKIVLDVIGQ